MTLPSVAEIQALTPADAMRAAIKFVDGGGRFLAPQFGVQAPEDDSAPFVRWLSDVLEESDVIVSAVGGVVREMLVIERERMDRDAALIGVRDKHPGLSDAEAMRPFGTGGL